MSITSDARVWVTWNHAVGTAKHIDASIVRTEVTSAAPGDPFPAPSWDTRPYPTQLNGPTVLPGHAGPVLARGDGNGRVILQRLLSNGRLGPTIALSRPHVRNQQLAVDAHGRGIAVWDAHIVHANLPEARNFILP